MIAPREAPFVVGPFITWTAVQHNGVFVTVTAATHRPWDWEMHCFVAWPDRVRDSPLWGSAL